MKKAKKLLQVLICGSIIFSLSGCSMIQKTPEAKKKTVVAKVGDDKITLKDVDDQLGSYITQIKEQYGVKNIADNEEALSALKQYRESLLDALVQQAVFIKKADQLKLKPSDAELNKELESRMKTIKGMYSSDSDYQSALKNENITEDQLKNEIKKSIITEKVKDYITKDVKITEADAKKYYDENKATSYTKNAGADMYHILVADEAKAKEIKTKLDNGSNFGDLAKEYGTDGTKTTGGSLGYVEYDTQNMDSDFMAAAKKLKDGEISGPVKTQFGYHIIMVKNVHNDKYVQPFDDVKSEIESTLAQTKQQEAIQKKTEEWEKEYKVKENKKALELTY